MKLRTYRLILTAFLIFLTPISAGANKIWGDPGRLPYPPLTFSPPRVEKEKLPSGTTLFFLENHELPIVHISIYVRAGSMYDPPGKEGLAELTAQVMRTGGARSWKGDEVDSILDRMAAQVEPVSRDEMVIWKIDVLAKDLKATWRIFCALMREPNFEPEKIKTALALKKGELKRIADNPQRLAFREFQRLYFQGNAQGRLPKEESLASITREDIIAFYRRHYFPNNLTVAVSGDITKGEIVSLLQDDLLRSWENQPPLLPLPPPVWRSEKRRDCLLKDTPQAVVITGQPAPAKTNPDYYAFEILDFILGSGGFRSRIFQEVRTNRGLSYSTGSFYRAKSDYGLFGTYVITQNKSAPLAFSTIKHILEEAKKGIEAKEVVRAQKAILNSFVFDYGTPRQIVEREAEAYILGWPADFWPKYPQRITQVRAASVTEVARKYLIPEKMQVFILGKEEACASFPHAEKVKVKP